MSLQSQQGTGVSARVRWLAFAAAKCKAIQLSIERRTFERKLETIVRAANAHHSCGRSPGAIHFKLLRTCADELCADFAQRWEIPPELLEAQIPAITKLKSLADPPTKSNRAPSRRGWEIVVAAVPLSSCSVSSPSWQVSAITWWEAASHDLAHTTRSSSEHLSFSLLVPACTHETPGTLARHRDQIAESSIHRQPISSQTSGPCHTASDSSSSTTSCCGLSSGGSHPSIRAFAPDSWDSPRIPSVSAGVGNLNSGGDPVNLTPSQKGSSQGRHRSLGAHLGFFLEVR